MSKAELPHATWHTFCWTVIFETCWTHLVKGNSSQWNIEPISLAVIGSRINDELIFKKNQVELFIRRYLAWMAKNIACVANQINNNPFFYHLSWRKVRSDQPLHDRPLLFVCSGNKGDGRVDNFDDQASCRWWTAALCCDFERRLERTTNQQIWVN